VAISIKTVFDEVDLKASCECDCLQVDNLSTLLIARLLVKLQN